MAASDCDGIRFITTRSSNAFCFQVGAADEVDSDSFTDSSRCLCYKIQCRENKYLYLSADQEFQLEHLTEQEQTESDCVFNIRVYNDSCLERREGAAVMLYINKGGKKLVASGRRNEEVHPEVMELPHRIPGRTHNALFYLIQLTTDKYMFEWSVDRTKCLGFVPLEENNSLKRVVLQTKGQDGLDLVSEAILSKC